MKYPSYRVALLFQRQTSKCQDVIDEFTVHEKVKAREIFMQRLAMQGRYPWSYAAPIGGTPTYGYSFIWGTTI